jgi:hypothetical protein
MQVDACDGPIPHPGLLCQLSNGSIFLLLLFIILLVGLRPLVSSLSELMRHSWWNSLNGVQLRRKAAAGTGKRR